MADSAQSLAGKIKSSLSQRPASLEDALAKIGLLTPQQLDFVKSESKRREESADKILAQMAWVTSEQLAQAKAAVLGITFVTPDTKPISSEVLSLIPDEVAKRFTVIPISRDRDMLSVAMVDTLDLQAIEFLEKKSNLVVKPYMATEESIKKAIVEQYTRVLSFEVMEALKEAGSQYSTTFMPQAAIAGVMGHAPVARIVSTLLEYGIKVRASDIHIEPLENETRVRYRIDGILHEKLILPRRIHDSLISRIKILSDMKIDEKRLPQDGRFNFQTDV